MTTKDSIRIEESHLERFIKLVGFFTIQNNHKGIIDFGELMNDLKNTVEYKKFISDYEIVERLKERLERLKKIPKNDEDFLFTHYKLEIEDYESILENKK